MRAYVQETYKDILISGAAFGVTSALTKYMFHTSMPVVVATAAFTTAIAALKFKNLVKEMKNEISEKNSTSPKMKY